MSDSSNISRRNFLRWLAGGAAAVGLGSVGVWKWAGKQEQEITGAIQGANSDLGHLVRKGLQKKITEQRRVGTLIVGGGMAGLSVGWYFQKQGKKDFEILEMDRKVGGNAVSGSHNNFSYPWGAHYLPLPNPENTDLLGLLEDLGCLTGWQDGQPRFEELYLCHAPQERLLHHGVWQEGLVPKAPAGSPAAAELDRFFTLIQQLRHQRGADGRYLFDIPVDRSSTDPEWQSLDQISLAEWLERENYHSEELHWYLDYCCQDDFGSRKEQTSAWAGLHYFAARRGTAANATENSVLTWPEGNGWLVQQLRDRLQEHIQTESLVLSLESLDEQVRAVVYRPAEDKAYEIIADQAVCCTPQFVSQHIVRGPKRPVDAITYAPWLVANVELGKRPGGPGRPLSWDNVAFGRDSLGYVVADHQGLKRPSGPVVVSWYAALAHADPVQVRKEALETEWPTWRDRVIEDLEWMHPGISKEIKRLDVYVWGHGMVTPRLGYLSGATRPLFRQPQGRIHYAHTDLSGISIFEEAFAQGVRAAREVLGEEVPV